MGRNSHYFQNKEERAAHASQVVEEMRRDFGDAIKYSVKKHNIDLVDFSTKPFEPSGRMYNISYDTSFYVENMDSVSALFGMNQILEWGETRKSPCILNFASFKNPGGMFINGSSAQEESLCHESDLYLVLSDPQIVSWFYEKNKKLTNNHLYASRSLYTPNIVFKRDGERCIEYANVITCAAPNAHAAKKYCNMPDYIITRHLIHRIKTVLHHAYINDCDVLILGAYGCGVFGNDPFDVAYIFNTLLRTTFKGRFSAVIFAVPADVNKNNYRAFHHVTNNEEQLSLDKLEERRDIYYGDGNDRYKV